MTLIIIALALSAVYSGATYLLVYYLALQGRVDRGAAATDTFHLGLCFILSVGFLGLILGGS